LPPLLQPQPEKDAAALAHRQAAAAIYIPYYSDACTDDGRNGLGFVVRDRGGTAITWGMGAIPELRTITRADGTVVPVDINLLELIAAVLAFAAIARLHVLHLSHHTLPTPPCPTSPHTLLPCHVHLWTDNTSCRAWLTSFAVTHPLHRYLLQVFSHLQVLSGLTCTQGHVPGAINHHADAASRSFNVPNGAQLRRDLRSTTASPISQTFLRDMVQLASSPSTDTSQLQAAALTAAARLLFSDSA
jgi:hypothetical protein